MRPAFLDVLPISTNHGTLATTNEFLVNGYTWRIDGNRNEPWSVLGAGGPYEDNANGYINDLTAFLVLTFPVPFTCAGIHFTAPQGFSGSDAWPQILFEGLDRSNDPNGVWRSLAPPIQIPGTAAANVNTTFSLQIPIEQLRISSANANNPAYSFAKGFRFGKILSLY